MPRHQGRWLHDHGLVALAALAQIDAHAQCVDEVMLVTPVVVQPANALLWCPSPALGACHLVPTHPRRARAGAKGSICRRSHQAQANPERGELGGLGGEWARSDGALGLSRGCADASGALRRQPQTGQAMLLGMR